MNLHDIISWIAKNPDRTIYILLSVLGLILRFTKPGSRSQAIVTSLSGDVVKLYAALAKKPLPGGFSPAPAEIPMTTQGAIATALASAKKDASASSENDPRSSAQ